MVLIKQFCFGGKMLAFFRPFFDGCRTFKPYSVLTVVIVSALYVINVSNKFGRLFILHGVPILRFTFGTQHLCCVTKKTKNERIL